MPGENENRPAFFICVRISGVFLGGGSDCMEDLHFSQKLSYLVMISG